MSDVVVFLFDAQNRVSQVVPNQPLKIFTEHRRGDHVFRGHPNHRGKGHWKDWAIVNWGATWGKLPSHVWCFAQLQSMPIGNQTIWIERAPLRDGVCAVVEVAVCDADEETSSSLTCSHQF